MTFDPKTYNSEKKKNKYSKSNHNKDSVIEKGRYRINYQEIPKLLTLLYEIQMFDSCLSGWTLTFLNSMIDNFGKQYEEIKLTQARSGNAVIISEKQYLILFDIICKHRYDNNINQPLAFQFNKIDQRTVNV
ncbi:hypothetical protein OAU72_04085, partial [Hyphomicrobiales bacterium]|nr:hypothetical protein [Hyphomicrobiales bacterium]